MGAGRQPDHALHFVHLRRLPAPSALVPHQRVCFGRVANRLAPSVHAPVHERRAVARAKGGRPTAVVALRGDAGGDVRPVVALPRRGRNQGRAKRDRLAQVLAHLLEVAPGAAVRVDLDDHALHDVVQARIGRPQRVERGEASPELAGPRRTLRRLPESHRRPRSEENVHVAKPVEGLLGDQPHVLGERAEGVRALSGSSSGRSRWS